MVLVRNSKAIIGDFMTSTVISNVYKNYNCYNKILYTNNIGICVSGTNFKIKECNLNF